MRVVEYGSLEVFDVFTRQDADFLTSALAARLGSVTGTCWEGDVLTLDIKTARMALTEQRALCADILAGRAFLFMDDDED